jgi:hypothetical protein
MEMNIGNGDGGVQPSVDPRLQPLSGGVLVGGGMGGMSQIVTIPMASPLDEVVDNHSFPILTGATFPKGSWDPLLRAQVVLGEFGATQWRAAITVDPKFDMALLNGAANLADEVDQLIALMPKRATRMGEIIAQAQDLTLYWGDLLMAAPGSRPATWVLVAVGVAVGQLVSMRLKWEFQRARPVQVYPALMPPLLTPGHASFPNSHALQSYLISGSIQRACLALEKPLNAIADRVRMNREIAGLHFPSDGEASLKIAPQVLALLDTCPSFQELIAEAKAEWQGVTAVGHATPPPPESAAQPAV